MRMAIRKIAQAAGLTLLCIVSAACVTETNGVDFAEANIARTNSGNVSGIVRFSDRRGYVQVTGTLEGLKPGSYVVVLHEPGLCDKLAETSVSNVASFDVEVAEISMITMDQRGQTTIDIGRTDLPEENGPGDLLGRSVVVMTVENGEWHGAAGCGSVRPIPDVDYTL